MGLGDAGLAQALKLLARFGSVTVLNGHIHHYQCIPIFSRFRAWRIVTRAQAPASAGRSAFRAFSLLPDLGFRSRS